MSDAVFDLDELLDAAVLEGVLAEGRDPQLAARQFGAPRVIASMSLAEMGPHGRPTVSTTNRWSAADVAFLRENAGRKGDEELAERLGRSATAVRVRRRRLGLPGPSVHPDYITAQGIAKALGIDVHAVCVWIERGVLAAELSPLSDRKIWRVGRPAFYAWALRPDNWIYFYRSVRDTTRIRDTRLRRMIVLRAERWGDEWWTTGEVAEYHGVDSNDVVRHIKSGRLPAARWSNWMVLRSEATRPGLRFYKGIGDAVFDRKGTPAGDAFIVLAAAVGIPWAHIGRMMKKQASGIQPRLNSITRRGLAPWLIRAFELPVELRDDGSAWCDWRRVAPRFPLLDRSWEKLGRGERLANHERILVTSVLRKFVMVHRPESDLSRRLSLYGNARMKALREAQMLFEETVRE